MAVSQSRTIQKALTQPPATPVVLTALGACFAVAMGLLLVGTGATAAVLLLLAIGVILLALWSPYWALVVIVAQFAFIPCEGEVLGQFIPNVLQLLAPIAFAAALLQALKEADTERLTVLLPDLLVAGFGLWGIISMFVSPAPFYWKWYGNRMLLPMMLYYVARLIPLDRKHLSRMLLAVIGAVALQSVLMVRESIAGSSPLYQVARGTIQGVKPASGPFPFFWNAATYLCLWPSVFVYAIAQSRNWAGRTLWTVALMVTLAASTRTMERAAVAASLAGIATCLLSPKLRRTTLAVLGTLAVCYVPWSMGAAGSALLDRFGETDESRYAYRTTATNYLMSGAWDPVFGIGWASFRHVSGGFGTDEEVLAWGYKRATVREVAAHAALHNVWLAVPVEFGGVGVLLALGLAGSLLLGLVRMVRERRHHPMDDGLLTSMIGSLVALAGIGYYHNVYMMAESMSVLWLFYGLLTTQRRAFVAR